MLAAANGEALWYLTRGTGLVSLLLLTGSVVLGIVGVQRWASPRWPRFVTGALHRNLSLLAVAFLAVHIVTAVTDSYVTIRWINVFVPLTGTYRPFWLGLGALAGDLLLALIVTSLLRRHLGYCVWKAVHWAAYACWPVALVHAIGTGTDVHQRWGLFTILGCAALFTAAVWWRLSEARPALVPYRAAREAVPTPVPVPVRVPVRSSQPSQPSRSPGNPWT